MISSLTGTISYHGIGFVIVQVHGVGYKVTFPEDISHGLSGELILYTHEAQREDGRELFGFTTIAGLELAWKLMTVSGVGPKLAQKIVYGGSPKEVSERITAGDVTWLSTIPGLGTKTAQKIVLELQGKLVAVGSGVDADALAGLMGLGYQKFQAEEVLHGLSIELTTEQRIRSALKILGRH
ncbi:MAG: Holliday junction branch migration protein RuvA [Patescibacteria group bacterium]